MEKLNLPPTVKLDITWISLFRVITVILGLIFIYYIRDIIALIFIVFIIVAALSPAVGYFEKKMPRTLAVILLYLILIALISLISIIVFNPLAHQIKQLADSLPILIERNSSIFQSWRDSQVTDILQDFLKSISGRLSQLTGNVFQTIFSIFGGFITAITVFIMSFYLLLEEKSSKKALETVLPETQHIRAYEILRKFSEKLGSWFRGQLLLMIIIGVLDFIILSILKVEGSLALATWGGITELIPIIGPIIGAIPAIIIALTTKGIWSAFLVGVLLIGLIQWLESQFIVPNVMKKAVGLSPVIIIIAILIGGKLMGIFGVVIAVPVAAIISVVVHEWESIVKIYNSKG